MAGPQHLAPTASAAQLYANRPWHSKRRGFRAHGRARYRYWFWPQGPGFVTQVLDAPGTWDPRGRRGPLRCQLRRPARPLAVPPRCWSSFDVILPGRRLTGNLAMNRPAQRLAVGLLWAVTAGW